ncbi:O-antigen ligase [Enterobacter sp. ENT03]|uniref:O-antigen ligase family protein n=1 Tax=Enterobacter sp. ENT03 TaxID=2854780 RepID=UPI002108D651|nr:O-antigen ligase family protein [Enterobacter sp. ENT03]
MLFGHVFSNNLDRAAITPFAIAEWLFKAGCLLSFSLLLINPDLALKFFIATTGLSLPVIGKNLRSVLADKRVLILPGLMILFGVLQIVWVDVFKHSESIFTAAYRSYQNGGKVLIFSGFVALGIYCQKRTTSTSLQATSAVVILVALMLYLYGAYQYFVSPGSLTTDYRVTLGFEHATGTAYALTFIALIASQAILNLGKKFAVVFYFLHFIISFALIILTQTRAAILLYPVLAVVFPLLHFRKKPRILMQSIAAFLVIMFISVFALQPVLEKRYTDFKRDMHAYSKQNSRTSIGARLAMQHAAYIAGVASPLGQSLEQRNAYVKAAATSDPSLKGATVFLNVHLHNEIMDTFSLKGIPGVIALLMLYLAMLYTAYIYRNPLLGITTCAIILYGMSDVLLYAKGEALSAMLAICIASMLIPGNSTVREKSYE